MTVTQLIRKANMEQNQNGILEDVIIEADPILNDGLPFLVDFIVGQVEAYEKWLVEQFWDGIAVAIEMSGKEDIIEIMESVGWCVTDNGEEIDGYPCFNCLHYGWEFDNHLCNGNGRCINCMETGFGMHDATNLDNLLVRGTWLWGAPCYEELGYDEVEEGEVVDVGEVDSDEETWSDSDSFINNSYCLIN